MMNVITSLLKIQYPIIQGGMVWCSGWRLASAVSNAGGLGVIGSGSMKPEVLEEHILKCKAATSKPFGVNIPLLYAHSDQTIELVLKHKIPVVITSAGNPKQWTSHLKENGITVLHVVSSAKFALKAQEAGVDAVIAEGFEAGGHNGREETTTLCLIPLVSQSVSIPVIAAGGISSGKAILACMALGAQGVQIGSRFAACAESSAHKNFKTLIHQLKEGETILSLKQLAPVRLIKNAFYQSVAEAEAKGASSEELKVLLGKGRSRIGIFEGDLENGELEIGQVSALLTKPETVNEIFTDLLTDFEQAKEKVSGF